MASTYSALKIELIATGEQSGTWGATTNVNLGDAALGEAITGSADVAFSSADVTITLVDTNATQSARNLRLNLTGTSGGARNLILGSGCQIEKLYLVNNGLADAVTVKNTTGTGIAVAAGKTMFVYNNGTNVVDAITHLTSLTTGVLSASGATTFTAGTASTSTTTGTTVITGGLGVSGRINAANFDGIVGANTAAAGSFTTINASTSITNAGLTSGRVTFAGASGLLSDSANLTFDGTMLSAPVARIGTYATFGTESLQVAKANGTGAVGSAYQFAINSKGSTNRAEMILTDGATANAFISYKPSATAASDRLTFNLQGSDILTVVGNNQVGIGTSSPVSKLDVTGQVTATGGIFKANGAPALVAATAGEAILAPEGTYGALLYGRGTTYDVVLAQRSTGVALGVLAGTNNVTFPGLVGIGTSSPEANAKLTVYGSGVAISRDSSTITPSGYDLKIRSASPKVGIHATGASQNMSIEFSGGGGANALLDVQSGDGLVINTNATERMRITSAGLVGIGTSSPNTLFSVAHVASAGTSIGIQHSSNNAQLLRMGWNDSTDYTFINTSNGSRPLVLQNTGGNVGIGETSPFSLLSVTQARQGNNVGTGAALLMSTATTASDRLNLNFSMNGIGGRARAAIGAVSNDTGGYNCSLAFYARNAGDGSDLQITDERMRLDSSGELLIGRTSSPSAGTQLNIYNVTNGGLSFANSTNISAIAQNGNDIYFDISRAGTAGNLYFRNSNSFTTQLTLASTGNVGIGTNSPNYKLQLNDAASSASCYLQITHADAGTANTDGLQIGLATGSSPDAYIGQKENAALIFQTNSAERMRIDSSGNVGIGTSSPYTKLHVTGTIKTAPTNQSGVVAFGGTTDATTQLGIFRGAANSTSDGNFLNMAGYEGLTFSVSAANIGSQTERMRIDSSGNLGVGTSSPTKRLEVQSSTTGEQNARFIDNSGVGNGGRGGGISMGGVSNDTGPVFTDYVRLLGLKTNSTQGNTQGGLLIQVNDGSAQASAMSISSARIVTMDAYGSGTATFSASGVISSVSDETWKTKDGVPTNTDAMLQKLEPGYWFYNEEKAPIFGADRQLGFYAQNVHEAIGSEAAPTPEEGKPWGYYDRSVLAVVVMSLKNALTTIEELKQRIKVLENK